MPLSNAKYRFVTTPSGKKVRLAWQKGKVVEARKFEKGNDGKLKKGRFLKKADK
jgi:hypothetical protein